MYEFLHENEMHGIKVATIKSGLSAHVIRMWEKRYNAVQPERTETNRRIYNDQCIQRLTHLAQLTQNGHSIGQIANLDDETLLTLHRDIVPAQTKTAKPEHNSLVEQSLVAISRFDQHALESLLDEATKQLGYSGLLQKVLIPLIHRVGESWHSGAITAAEEHAATSFIKDYLCVSTRPFTHDPAAPKLLITTPPGQLHELGAVIATSLARKLGWQVVYLGVSLPPEEIAGAAEKIGARAVALSIVYPLDDPQINLHLQRLRKLLDSDIPVIIGGAQSSHYQPTIQQLDLIQLGSIHDFSAQLNTLRTST